MDQQERISNSLKPPRRIARQMDKMEIAERQLCQAIDLLFVSGDPVSIHTLTGAATQILWDLQKPPRKSILRELSSATSKGKSKWEDSFREHVNAFKHADRDPEKKYEFQASKNHFQLYDAIYMHRLLSSVRLPQAEVFLFWFYLTYPNVFRNEKINEMVMAFYKDGGGDLQDLKFSSFSSLINVVKESGCLTRTKKLPMQKVI